MEECLEGEEDCHRRFRLEEEETGHGEHFLGWASTRWRTSLGRIQGRDTVCAGVIHTFYILGV